MIRTVLHSSDNVISIEGVRDILTGETIESASVWVSIFDASGENVDGVVWPVTLGSVEGSNGDYRGLIPDTVELKVGKYYRVRVSVDDGPGRKVQEEHDLEIVGRLP